MFDALCEAFPQSRSDLLEDAAAELKQYLAMLQLHPEWVVPILMMRPTSAMFLARIDGVALAQLGPVSSMRWARCTTRSIMAVADRRGHQASHDAVERDRRVAHVRVIDPSNATAAAR